ncbi:hypothetical protein VP01_5653g1, partial [Puccinia sorghi]
RKLQSSRSTIHPHSSLGSGSTEARDTSQPTTAELAEAAARKSNVHHSLPAFYSPDDELLKVRTVVIPVDTNPMERRKIIVDFSKDISIRWRDSHQKTMFERSEDGLVGEEIGTIEFDYLCLPKKPLRKSCPHTHHDRPHADTARTNSSAATHQRPHGPPTGPDIVRSIRDAVESADEGGPQESRTIRLHHDLHHRPYDSHYQYRLRGPPGFRVTVARGNNNHLSSREMDSESTHATGSLGGTAERPPENGRDMAISRTTRPARSTSTSGGRLTRRPIRWFERPSIRDLASTLSRSSNPDPSLTAPQPPPAASSSLRTQSSTQDVWADDLDVFYQQLYNPHHPLDQFLFSSSIHRSGP